MVGILFPRGPVGAALRHVGVASGWRMYSPDVARDAAAVTLFATMADGERRALHPEAELEAAAWGAFGAWNKTRMDVWRAAALGDLRRGSHARQWYLRAACVREARRGEVPVRITMEAVVRQIPTPADARAGAPELGPRKRVHLGSVHCESPRVAAMIEADPRGMAGE